MDSSLQVNKTIPSMIANYNCINHIYSEMYDILQNINYFEKKVPPTENNDWTKDEITSMPIDIKSIDMLFDINTEYTCQNTEDEEEICEYYLVARQLINETPIYFSLYIKQYDDYCIGEITFGKNPKKFIKDITYSDCFKERMFKFLEMNGLSFPREKFTCPACQNLNIYDYYNKESYPILMY